MRERDMPAADPEPQIALSAAGARQSSARSSVPSALGPMSTRSLPRTLRYALRAMRPQQWTKNGLVVLAAVFAHRATDLRTMAHVAAAVVAFSLAASAIYIVNDIADRAKDRLHPRKRLRPIAAGSLSLSVAASVAGLCLIGAAAVSFLLIAEPIPALRLQHPDPFAPWGGGAVLFALSLLAYLAINVAYSIWMKHQVLWDVFVIAAGFVLRALAGAFVAAVVISPWFYLAALFLSLFLALGKRRAELMAVSVEGTRPSLREYTQQLLDQLLTVVVACTLMTYSLYTFQTPGSGNALMITIPFVVFGVFRYLYLIYVKGEGESPEVLLLRDRQILGAVVLCALVAVLVLYGLPAVHLSR